MPEMLRKILILLFKDTTLIFSLEKDATTDLLKCVADFFIRKMEPIVAQDPVQAVVP